MNYSSFNPWHPYSTMEEFLAARGITTANTHSTGTPVKVTEDNGVTTVVYSNGMKVTVGGGYMAIDHKGKVFNTRISETFSTKIGNLSTTLDSGKVSSSAICTVQADGRIVAQVSGNTIVNISNARSVSVIGAAGVAINGGANANLTNVSDVYIKDVTQANVFATNVAIDGRFCAGRFDIAKLEKSLTPLVQLADAVDSGAISRMPTVSTVDGNNVININNARVVVVNGGTAVAVSNAANLNVTDATAVSACGVANINAVNCKQASLRNVIQATVNGRLANTSGARTVTNFNSSTIRTGNITVTINGHTVSTSSSGSYSTTVITGGSGGYSTTIKIGGSTVISGGGQIDVSSLLSSVLGGTYISTTTTGNITSLGNDLSDLLQSLFGLGSSIIDDIIGEDDDDDEGYEDDDTDDYITGTITAYGDHDAKGPTFSPDLFKGHVYFDSRNIGWCKKLVGNVTLVNLMVDDTYGSWSSSYETEDLKRDVTKACNVIQTHAREYGVTLKLTPVFKHLKIDCKAGTTNHWNFREHLAAAMGYQNMQEVYNKLVREYGGDEVAIIVTPHHSARSFAFAAENDSYNMTEYALVYTEGWSSDRAGTYIHELLHLFGAEDFYFPEDTVKAAQRYFPDTIMSHSSCTAYFDPVTRYLIGWTNRLTQKAKNFLDDTKHLTRFMIIEARRHA